MNSQTIATRPAAKYFRSEFFRTVLLAVAITILWCVLTDRTSLWKWKVPVLYAGDGLMALGWVKCAADGHYWPVLSKINPSLGAPFTGNWNDYPVTEDTLFCFSGGLAKLVGLFPGYNLTVLIGAVLVGVTFYLTCRWLRYKWEWAFAGAIAFTFSSYAFWHSFGHIVLGYYWHIPLCILVCWWMSSRRGLDLTDKRFWFAIAVGLVTGIQNAYYTNLFLQFTAFAFLAQLIRRSHWRKLLAPVAVGAVTVFAFVLMNVDTLSYLALNGENPNAVVRSYSQLETYALRPIELIIPSPFHRIKWMGELGSRYDGKTFFHGQANSMAYLGVIGVSALVWLLGMTVVNLLRRPARPIPSVMAQIIWIITYATVGGWNCLVGFLGLELFRCTQRFSIWILALVLLFLVRRLSRMDRGWPAPVRAGLAFVLCAVAVADQEGPIPSDAKLKATAATIDSDRRFAEKLDHALPAESMIFQLPVMDYPESAPIGGMGDYAHLRPYLFSHRLRYSYGNDKGREPDQWQHETGSLKPEEMIARLESCGFGAIYLNRKGYSDNGKTLIDSLRNAGRGETISSSGGDLLCVLLHPSDHPVLPNPLVRFMSGWYELEHDPVSGTSWRWSSGDAEIDAVNESSTPVQVRLSFDVSSLVPRKLTVMNESTTVLKTAIGQARTISEVIVALKPGRNRLLFKIDIPAATPSGSSSRESLAFR